MKNEICVRAKNELNVILAEKEKNTAEVRNNEQVYLLISRHLFMMKLGEHEFK